MSSLAIMELIGVLAGLAAAVFYLLGRQRRIGGHSSKLFAILLIAVLANSAIDLVEQTGSYRRLDLAEDYVDMVMLFIWGIFIFSLFPEYSTKTRNSGDLRSVFTWQLAVVFSILLVLNVVYSMTLFIKSRDTLTNLRDHHGPAMVLVAEMRSRSNNAIQESFAYVVSGEETEKEEFEDYVQSFQEYAEAFRRHGRLHETAESGALAIQQTIVSSQSELVQRAQQMFVEFEANDEVSLPTYQEYEASVDQLDADFERLEQSERLSFENARATATRMLEDASFELPILAGFSVAICVGLFGLLSWSFRQYSSEQEFARGELIESEKQQRQASESLRQRDQAFRVAITPIVFADLEGRITETNQAFAKLFGFESPDQVIGQLNTTIHSEPISISKINAGILEQGRFDGEITSKRLDGTPIEIQISAAIFSDADGRPIGSIATYMDVTPRRQLERALRDSEQHYRTLVEAAPEAIIVVDVDQGTFVDFNNRAMELFRVQGQQFTQIGPIDLSPETQPDGQSSATAAMQWIQQALDGELPTFDWVHMDTEGNEIQCEVRLARLSSSRRLVRGSVTDISKRIELENTLSRRAVEAELLYQAAAMADEIDSLDAALQKCVDIVCEMTTWPVGHAYVPSSGDGGKLVPTSIWHFSDERRFATFRNLTERTSFRMGEGLLGRVWLSGKPDWIVNVQHDDNFTRNRVGADLGVKGGFGFPVKIRGETVAILEFYNEAEVERDQTFLLLVQAVGEQVGRVIERKEAAEASRRQHQLVAEELEKAKGELVLKTRLAAIGQMSAQIAHEMRNPLGAVSNAVYYLKQRVPAGERKWSEYLSLIDREVGTCNQFIGDLLDVTRGRAPNRVMTDLANLIDRVLTRHNIPEHVNVQVLCQPDPFEIFVDRDQIVQVIDNLIKNSLDAIGDQEGRIEIRALRNGNRDTITFLDSGKEIRAEHRTSVFDVLFTTKPTGTGLGLPICRQIVERHGGTIEIIDELSPGTKFEVCLPHNHSFKGR